MQKHLQNHILVEKNLCGMQNLQYNGQSFYSVQQRKFRAE